MKPLKLTVKGLHSFQEKQTIDFNMLISNDNKACKGNNSCKNIFGIFGPTGSGKTSLLDAITLSLYGRLLRGNQLSREIINDQCEALDVSFSFQFSNGEGCKSYKVKRNYVNVTNDASSYEGGIILYSAIFVDQCKGTTIANDDKVTEAVKKLLGITYDDFIRMVVLPQGRIYDYMTPNKKTLKPMFQRVFGLEKYDLLFKDKLNKRLLHTEQDLEVIKKDLQLTGDCSEEAQDSLQHKLTSISDQLNKTKDYKNMLQVQLDHDREQFSKLEKQNKLEDDLRDLHEKLSFYKERLKKTEEDYSIYLTVQKELNERLLPLESKLKIVSWTKFVS